MLIPRFIYSLITLFITLLSISPVIAQHLDVEGHTRIRGSIDIHHMDDSTSIFIGKNAGQNSFPTIVPTFSNTFIGLNAGKNTHASDNTFVGSRAGEFNSNGSGNSFFGSSSGLNNTGSNNSFFGRHAGLDNTVGFDNAFFGASAGSRNISGSLNSFFGYDAGYSNEDGKQNSFFGHEAGFSVKSGNANSFFGSDAGFNTTSGSDNAFFGHAAGFSNTTGEENAFFGFEAGRENITGNNNTFLGWQAGESSLGHSNTFLGSKAGAGNTTGIENIFIGSVAGLQNGTGSRNVFIQAGTDAFSNLEGAIAIGYGAAVNCDYCAMIGGTGSDRVKVGIGTSNPDADVEIRDTGNIYLRLTSDNNLETGIDLVRSGISNSDFRISNNGGILEIQESTNINATPPTAFYGFTKTSFRPHNTGVLDLGISNRRWRDLYLSGMVMNASDSRLKQDIRDLSYGLATVLQLRPVQYTWKADPYRENLGLIAQEVEEILPHVVRSPQHEQDHYSINYIELVPVLINAIKELKTENELLHQQLSQLQEGLNNVILKLDEAKSGID
jgi:trimeric autotransporter adhesin